MSEEELDHADMIHKMDHEYGIRELAEKLFASQWTEKMGRDKTRALAAKCIKAAEHFLDVLDEKFSEEKK